MPHSSDSFGGIVFCEEPSTTAWTVNSDVVFCEDPYPEGGFPADVANRRGRPSNQQVRLSCQSSAPAVAARQQQAEQARRARFGPQGIEGLRRRAGTISPAASAGRARSQS